MHRAPRRLASLVLVLLAACGAPSAPRSPRPGPAAADKAALFGDPSLVPTREGERARREIALAQEIERAIGVLPRVDRARVNVELPAPSHAGSEAEHGQARVLAVVRARSDADAPALSPQVQTIAHAVVGPTAAVEVVVEGDPAPSPPAERSPWPLLLGVLGLGWSGGTLLERTRRLRRSRASRPRPRA